MLEVSLTSNKKDTATGTFYCKKGYRFKTWFAAYLFCAQVKVYVTFSKKDLFKKM